MENPNVTKEQVARLKACESAEEVLALAKQEGIELTDAQLDAVSGGWGGDTPNCPYCGSSNVDDWGGTGSCNNCGAVFVF